MKKVRDYEYDESQLPLVSISCITYNHGNYISEALDSFLDQVVDFPIEILVHDDASTDETTEIIREYEKKYPHIIKSVYQSENQYSKGVKVGKFNRERAVGKYYATCEGDDYWSDVNKLAFQISFLEKYEEFSFCCHRANIFNESEKMYTGVIPESLHPIDSQYGGLVIEHDVFFKKWVTQPLTTVIRTDLVKKLPYKDYKFFRDFHTFYFLLFYGKGICFDEVWGVYRHHEGGVHSSKSEIERQFTGFKLAEELFLKTHDLGLLRNYGSCAIHLLFKFKEVSYVLSSIFLKLSIKEKIALFHVFGKEFIRR
ncbi:glycosyltransferase [Myroides odoratimimus]|uniref:glycosyltransferase n=1 Tax=Myroides odoratimimus TaxID=76832 RepID=UPI0004681785|nr:glycosyltransferase [Myroides odoratimimus]